MASDYPNQSVSRGPRLEVGQRKIPRDTVVSRHFTRFPFDFDGRARGTVTSAGERELQWGICLDRLGDAPIRTHVGDRPEPI